jgi:hypothetical protein
MADSDFGEAYRLCKEALSERGAILEPPSFKELARVHRGWCNYCQGEWQICRDAPRGGCSLRDCEVEIENAGGIDELVADLHTAGTIARAIGNAAPQAASSPPLVRSGLVSPPAVAAPSSGTGECPNCKGSGETTATTQQHGPDDYEVTIACPECKGTGAVSPDKLEKLVDEHVAAQHMGGDDRYAMGYNAGVKKMAWLWKRDGHLSAKVESRGTCPKCGTVLVLKPHGDKQT